MPGIDATTVYQGAHEKKRKIVQFQIGSRSIMVLCDDGTIWYSYDEKTWEQMTTKEVEQADI